MTDQPLSAADSELWHAFKTMGDAVMSQVERELSATMGVSSADFAILTRIADADGGRIRQQALAALLGWNKSRLSHQLTRMEARGLVQRMTAGTVTTIVLTEEGRRMLAAVRPVHARAVRTHLIERLSPEERAAILGVADKLGRSPA